MGILKSLVALALEVATGMPIESTSEDVNLDDSGSGGTDSGGSGGAGGGGSATIGPGTGTGTVNGGDG